MAGQMRGGYYKFLISVSRILALAAAATELVTAILTYPPLMLGMTSEIRLDLLSTFTAPVIMLYAAFIIVDIKEKLIRPIYKAALLGAALCMPLGIYAYRLFDVTVAPYAFSGLALCFAPPAMGAILSGMIERGKKKKTPSAVLIAGLIVLALTNLSLLLLDLFCGYRTVIAAVCLLLFPAVQIIFAVCLFCGMRCKRAYRVPICISDLCALSLAAFIIIRMFSQDAAFAALRLMLAVSNAALAAEGLYFIKINSRRFKEKRNNKMENRKIKGAGFHHIGIKVKNFDASIKFYTEGLGFTVIRTWGEGDGRAAMLDIGGGDIMEMFAGGSDELNRENVWQHFAMHVDDTDQAYECAIRAGAKTIRLPETVTLDSKPEKLTIRIAFVSGPDGEQLEFFKIM